MHSTEQITEIIYGAIDEVNKLLPDDRPLVKSAQTVLADPSSEANLDSLAMVNLIMAIEQAIEQELGTSVALADQLTITERDNPFKTVETLSVSIAGLLNKRSAGSS